MTVRFNADEIFEMAIQIERNGAKFYHYVAEMAPSARTQQLLRQLAGMEVEHERTFAAIRQELKAHEFQTAIFDPDGQTGAYLRAMADGHVFDLQTPPTEKISSQASLPEILRLAIGLEKDSIVFYVGLKEMVPPMLGQQRITDIIHEEMNHIVTLNKELDQIKA
ncbi:ferritin family protein [candidate division KSB1 bacterium]|nr:ferritin family protein [candidate division KSB1 bacterium]